MIKCYFLLISIVIFLIFLILLFNYIYNTNYIHNYIYENIYITQKEDYSNYNDIYENDNIIYVTPNEAYNNIINNNYIDNFNDVDIKVRNCNNIEDCKKLYKKNIKLFTEKEKIILKKLVNKSNIKIKNFTSFFRVPWKFVRITNKIDNGLPHTHNDTIYLSDLFFENPSIEIIIHEKIHIYQKLNPSKSDKLYKEYNFKKIKRNNNKEANNNRRANPDLNDYDYKKNNKIIYSVYKDNAKSLSDIKLVNSNKESNINEHPDEYFAYKISKKIIEGFNKNDDKIINYLTI